MNNNTQVNEDYKFRISYVWNFFKDMVSSSGKVEDKELDARIEEVKNEQDSKYITNLEKDVETHDNVTKKRKTTRTSNKETKNNDVVEENMKPINKEVKRDEEKEL